MLSCPKSFGHCSGSRGQKRIGFFLQAQFSWKSCQSQKPSFFDPLTQLISTALIPSFPTSCTNDEVYKRWDLASTQWQKSLPFSSRPLLRTFMLCLKVPTRFLRFLRRPLQSEWWIPVVLGKPQNQKKINGWQDRKFTVNLSLSALIFQQSRCLLPQNHGPLQIWFVPSHLTFPRWIRDSVWISAHKT